MYVQSEHRQCWLPYYSSFVLSIVDLVVVLYIHTCCWLTDPNIVAALRAIADAVVTRPVVAAATQQADPLEKDKSSIRRSNLPWWCFPELNIAVLTL